MAGAALEPMGDCLCGFNECPAVKRNDEQITFRRGHDPDIQRKIITKQQN
jgi:hypothetical protein